MERWTASAKWGEGPALDGQRDMPLALRLSEGLGLTWQRLECDFIMTAAAGEHCAATVGN